MSYLEATGNFAEGEDTLSTPINTGERTTLLALLKELGLQGRFCNSGICTNCLLRIDDGVEQVRTLVEAQLTVDETAKALDECGTPLPEGRYALGCLSWIAELPTDDCNIVLEHITRKKREQTPTTTSTAAVDWYTTHNA